jgi:hypothetical protein
MSPHPGSCCRRLVAGHADAHADRFLDDRLGHRLPAGQGQDVGLVAEQIGNGLYNSYVLLAVPLFVFAANIMNAGTVSERIFDFCRILVGRMRGGLAQVDILVSVIFSGMSGSAIADAAGPGW